jgi:hypothetical protein
MNHVNTKEEVIEAFRIFDKQSTLRPHPIDAANRKFDTLSFHLLGTGYISSHEFRELLTELGEPMTPAEVPTPPPPHLAHLCFASAFAFAVSPPPRAAFVL